MNCIFRRTITIALAIVLVVALFPVPHAQAASLKQGSNGTEVRYLQENLIGFGYLTGTADGRYGPKTTEAVRRFQADFGLAVDGKAGMATQTALNNAVVRLQVELKRLGFAPGSADGHFGSKTQKALKEYQKSRGLEITGIADNTTWARINGETGGMRAGTIIPKGSTGTQVKYLQQALIGLGYLSGSADGKYGSITTEAVREYQSAYGLSADGSAGPKTMTSLRNTVSTLQSDLARRGWYTSSIDGVYGNGTRSAVKAYQQYVGVSATGVAGPGTMTKLYGYALGGSDNADGKVYKVPVVQLYQSGDKSEIWYDKEKNVTKTVESSGCAGVAMAMAVNALNNTSRHSGKSVMKWFVDHKFYYGEGTEHDGLIEFAKAQNLKAIYCNERNVLIEQLKKGRLAVVLLRDRTGEETFVSSESKGHYVLVSGYQFKDGVDRVYINNPVKSKASGWNDLDVLMSNTSFRDGFSPIIIIYK